MEQIATKPQGAHVLLSIQALRGFAVMGVILFHIQHYFTYKLQMPGLLPRFEVGSAGVDLFFVISGFIMVYAFERLFGQPGGTRIFLLRRLARIVPMYWAATTIFLFYVLLQYGSVDAATNGGGADFVIASYLFIPTRPDGWATPLLGVGWTLNYEMFFYALFGLLIAFSRRTVVAIVGIVFCALIALRLLGPPLPNPPQSWFNPIIIEFVFGMVIALAYRDGVRIPRWAVCALVAAGLAVFAWSWSRAHFFGPDSVLRVFAWGLPSLAIVGAFALAETPVARNVFWRIAGFLGDASYSLYLVHTLAIGVPLMVLGRFIAPASAPWFYLAAILIATIVPALFIHAYVEKPLTDWLQGTIERRGPRHVATTATASQAAP
jgi:peptidoglycan/LPS O-acetylase OafA/YrhL